MTTKINGRTPEEIKRGLECYNCKTCPYEKDNCGNVDRDALALIQQLIRERDEARNDLDTLNYANTELHNVYEAMKRERDAAVEDIKKYSGCSCCANSRFCTDPHPDCIGCTLEHCPCYSCSNGSNWQWRGVQEVN